VRSAACTLALLVACSSPTAPPPRAEQPHDGTYAGRPIAQTCSYEGAAWLERPDREAREQPAKVLDAIGLAPAMTVADVGAGTGYFTRRIAARVAHVIATDLQPQMRALLADNVAKAKLANVEIRAATDHDSGLPAACCDRVILVDVYHELADPAAVMATIARALRPDGRVILVEYRGEDPAVPIKPEHRMTLPQIQRELGALHFRFVESLEFLPDQRVVVFARE
jgi:cyclopropane fatty-acyl-phospholipid synthase-like methyltransferase